MFTDYNALRIASAIFSGGVPCAFDVTNLPSLPIMKVAEV